METDLRDGLAWITSTLVANWYAGLDTEAKIAFSAWVSRLRDFERETAFQVGPIIICSYLV